MNTKNETVSIKMTKVEKDRIKAAADKDLVARGNVSTYIMGIVNVSPDSFSSV